MASIKNTVIVALMQVGVIVFGVLGAAITCKQFSSMGAIISVLPVMLMHYGAFGFVLPLVWSATTLLLCRRPDISDDLKRLAFWSGVLLLLSLAVFMAYADVTPWLNVMWRMSAYDQG